MNLKGVEGSRFVLMEDFGGQHVAFDNLPDPGKQDAKSRPFARAQLQFAVTNARSSSVPIAGQGADGNSASGLAAVAAGNGADTSDQFGRGERLDQVIVSAELQSCYPVADRVAGGQHQDGGCRAASAKDGQDFKAVDVGKADVQNQGVEIADSFEHERFFAQVGAAGLHPCAA
ncbi:hypothetical protein D3C86_1154210 [compost metagenome]